MRFPERRACRTLLFGLGVYAVLQGSLVWLLTVQLPWLRSSSYADRASGLQKRMKETPQRPLTAVMFGTSRTVMGFKAALLDEPLSAAAGRPVVGYNFGFWGASPFKQLLSLRRLLADGVRPDLVVIEVLPVLLDADEPIVDLGEWHLPIQSLHRDELAFVRRCAAGQREVSSRDWWLSWTNPGYSHRLSLLSAVAPTLLRAGDRQDEFRHPEKGGWMPIRWRLDPEKRRAALHAVRRDFGPRLKTLRPGGRPVQLLDEMLQLCRKEKIPAALVLMPEGPVYRSLYSPSVWQQVTAVLGQLQERHHVPLIDAQCWVESEEAYLDSHHLLPDGAELFTRRLGTEALAPLLRRSDSEPKERNP